VHVCLYLMTRRQYIGYDNDNEYKKVFKEMCLNYGIKDKTSTTFNPQQSNGIIEHVHQVLVGNSLYNFELEEQELNLNNPWSPFLSAVAYAICSTYHTIHY
jgi:hypothetical protein